MDSSLIDNHNTSVISDAIDVNVGQSPNTLSIGTNGSGITADGGSASCLVVSDESDVSFSDSINHFNLKRKYGSEIVNGSLSEEDDSVSILKLCKLDHIPLLVQPIRSMKASEYETAASPGSVLEPLPIAMFPMEDLEDDNEDNPRIKSCRQFWKAGDYEVNFNHDPILSSVGMDHVRVHPKFLHSNATSHKWALGAFAELLDNSLDEVCNGATYINIDMLINERDGSRMLLIEDNGGGMCPDKMRRCMSLGYSSKRNMPNTIGQYGNGFKTSTMRLGADVLVFSRCNGSDQRGATQSIGMLSYTFLRDTGKEDIVVPMVDFEFKEDCWSKMMRSEDDWNMNLEIIVQWSPYPIEQLFEQFNFVKDQGTRIIIYNLWEDDEDVCKCHDWIREGCTGSYRRSRIQCLPQKSPFWRIWNPAGSDSRGVIGVLEANFVEPAHDKQGFERTIVLSRLESRLIQIQKDYWTKNCQEVGYAPRRRSVKSNDYNMDKMNCRANMGNVINISRTSSTNTTTTITPTGTTPESTLYTHQPPSPVPSSTDRVKPSFGQPQPNFPQPPTNSNGTLFGNNGISSLKGREELIDLLEPRLKDAYISSLMTYLLNEMGKSTCLESKVVTLTNQLHEATQKLEEKKKECMLQIDISSAEIMKKDKEIAILTEKLWDAAITINKQQRRICQLQNSITLSNPKTEPDDFAQNNS